ncbi:MAG: PKD domain-containing protein, partial [Bacteroidales bacterium]
MRKQFTLFIFLALLSISAMGQLRTSIRLGVFLIDFTDIPSDMRALWPTQSQWNTIMFNSKIKQYYDMISYNNCTVSGTVYNYTTSNLQYWNPSTGALKTVNEVIASVNINAPGYNPANFDYVVFLIGHDARLGGSQSYSYTYRVNGVQYTKPGLVTFFKIGKNNRVASNSIENSTVDKNSYLLPITTTNPPTTEEDYVKHPLSNFEQTFIHELIHSLGIGAHANSRTNNGKPDYVSQDPNNNGYWNSEYGNLYDIMGGSASYGSSLNGYFRRHIRFMDDNMLHIFRTYTTQTVTVYPLNNTSGKRLIAIFHPAYPTQWPGLYENDGYTLEVRTAGTFDPMLTHNLLKGNLEGLFVIKNSGLQNLMLDMSPSPNIHYSWGDFYDIRDVVLKPGMVYENNDVKFSNVIKNGDGSFTVTIQVKNSGTPIKPVANFSASPTSVTAGQSVTFTDLSTNTPTSWSWTFTGGTPSTSTAKNPVIKYNTAGTYNVTLTATNSAGSNTKTVTGYITVTGAVQKPVANFSASATSVTTGQSVTFTDLSTNTPTSWSWSFTGGTPATSTTKNPSVTYNTAGTYSVSLTATNTAGSGTKTMTGYITVSSTSTYCTAASTNSTYEWISKVEVGAFSNTSAASKYTDFTGKTISLTGNQSVSIKLTPSYSGTKYTEYFKVWVDYNKNGVFTDAGELVYSGSGAAMVTGTFTVKNVTASTRMRVLMSDNSGTTSPCGTFTYGEVEDYTVLVTAAAAKAIADPNTQEVAVAGGVDIYPNPSSSIVYIKGVKDNSVVRVIGLSGQVFEYRFNTSDRSIDVSSFPKGLYLIQVNTDGKVAA